MQATQQILTGDWADGTHLNYGHTQDPAQQSLPDPFQQGPQSTEAFQIRIMRAVAMTGTSPFLGATP